MEVVWNIAVNVVLGNSLRLWCLAGPLRGGSARRGPTRHYMNQNNQRYNRNATTTASTGRRMR